MSPANLSYTKFVVNDVAGVIILTEWGSAIEQQVAKAGWIKRADVPTATATNSWVQLDQNLFQIVADGVAVVSSDNDPSIAEEWNAHAMTKGCVVIVVNDTVTSELDAASITKVWDGTEGTWAVLPVVSDAPPAPAIFD